MLLSPRLEWGREVQCQDEGAYIIVRNRKRAGTACAWSLHFSFKFWFSQQKSHDWFVSPLYGLSSSCHIATSYTISKNNLSFSCFWFDLGLRRHKSDIGGDCWVGWAITGAGPEMGGLGRHSCSCSQPLQPLLTLLMPPLQTTLGCSGFYQSMFPSCSLKQLGHEYWWQRPHNASRIIFAKSEIETGNQKCANS